MYPESIVRIVYITFGVFINIYCLDCYFMLSFRKVYNLLNI